jgi:thiamine biosynthesis lipoprotein
VAIEAIAGDADLASRALEAGFAAIRAVHQAMSFHDPASVLSRINRDAASRPVRVDHHTWRVMRAADALHRATDGRFDPTVAGSLVAQGRLPRPEGAPDPVTAASWNDLDLSRHGWVRMRRPVWIDLGGIAKGYAVDRAIRAMRRAGAVSLRVNAGGDLRLHTPTAEPVHVRDPVQPGRVYRLGRLGCGAMATSAPYADDAPPWSGIVDPSGAVLPGDTPSVTVFARRCIWADALTKLVALAPGRAEPVVRRLGALAVVIHHGGHAQVLGTSVAPGWALDWQSAA